MLKRKKQLLVQPVQLAVAGGPAIPIDESENLKAHMGQIALLGIGVGALTGLVGVGGGFLIVPALVLLSGIPMKTAIGTSLAIVAANSSTGFAGYMGVVPVDWMMMASFTAVTVAGSFAGTRLAHRFSQETLKRSFGVFLVFVAIYILIKSVLYEILIMGELNEEGGICLNRSKSIPSTNPAGAARFTRYMLRNYHQVLA